MPQENIKLEFIASQILVDLNMLRTRNEKMFAVVVIICQKINERFFLLIYLNLQGSHKID